MAKKESCCGKTETEVTTKTTQYGVHCCPIDGKAGITYQGMRLVPVFADTIGLPLEWDKSASYEQLVVVEHNGDTYWSKIPVPPNTEITDTKYWYKSATYSAQFAELQALVNTFDGRIDELETEVPKLEFARPKFAIIGDSYSATNEAGTYGLWVNAFKFYTGLEVVRLAVSGSGFTRGGVNNFLGQLTALSERSDLDQIGFVILYGGVNDWRYNATVDAMKTAIQDFRNLWRQIKEDHPHIKLYTVFGNLGYAPQELYNGYMDWYEEITNAIRTTSSYQLENFINGAPYWLTPYTDAAYLSDKLHPSQAGHFVIASQMLKIVGGTYQGTIREGRVKNENLNTSTHWTYQDGKLAFSIKPLNSAQGITLPEGVTNNNLGALTFKPYIGTDVKRIYGTDMYVDWTTDTGVAKVRTYFNPNPTGSDAFYLQAVGQGAASLLPITCPAKQAVSDGCGQAY